MEDFRYGLRILVRSPGFTAAAVFILALGIAANTTIFSVVNALLFRPFPYPDAERIVYVFEGNERLQNWGAVSVADFEDWKKDNQVFERLALFSPDTINLSGAGEPERVAAMRVSADMISLFRIEPVLGRAFTSDQFSQGDPRSVLVSHGLWQRRFGANPNAVGQNLRLDGLPCTIVGILPPELKMGLVAGIEPEVVVPMAAKSSGSRDTRNVGAFARLKTGVTLEQARAEMSVIARRLQQQYPGTNSDRTVYVDTLRGSVDPVVYVLLVILICSVLGIACTNVSNLLLSRAVGRQKEVALRAALGATRRRILRQLLTEGVILAFPGCCFGLLISVWTCAVIRRAVAGSNVGVLDVRLDERVLLVSLALFAVTAVAIGLVPALVSTSRDLNQCLKEKSSAAWASPCRLRHGLAVAQIAVSAVLLCSAGLVIKSWVQTWRMDLGFQSRGVLTMGITLSSSEYPRDSAQLAFYGRLLASLVSRPQIESAALTSALPTAGPARPFRIAGRPEPARGEEPFARFYAASARYFSTLAIPVLAGRALDATDAENGPAVVVINGAMARRYWPGQNPVGAQIYIAEKLRTIVGVVGDTKSIPLNVRPFPELYVPFTQHPTGRMSLVIRTMSSRPLAAVQCVQREIQAINPNQPASGIRSMDQVMSANMGVISLGTSLLTVLAFGALILAAVGIYGVLSFSVSQRTAEIGIRLAIGAGRGNVLRLVLGQGLKLVTMAVVPGLAGSLALSRILSNRIHGVAPAEPLIMFGVLSFLSLVCVVACYLPARRATRIDPAQAFRAE